MEHPYSFPYHSDEDHHHQYAQIQYPPQMQPYHVVQNSPTPVMHDDLQALHMRRLNSLSLHHQYNEVSPLAAPFSASPPPLSPFDPISPPISGSDLSAGDAAYHSSGTGSPSSSRGTSLVHRHSISMRYNPTASTPSPSGSDHSRRGRRARQHTSQSPADGSDGDEPISIAESLAANRRESTRKQRIEAEQRRRDDLRDGYARLKDALPSSTVKSSKVSLLDRATTHINHLEQTTQALRARVMALESEIQRLRAVNETLMLSVANPHNTGSPAENNHQIMDHPGIDTNIKRPSSAPSFENRLESPAQTPHTAERSF